MDISNNTHTQHPKRLLTAQYLYLLTTPDGRNRQAGLSRFPALTAGLVADLMLRGHVRATEGTDPALQLLSELPTGDDVLDRFQGALAAKASPTLSSVLNDPGMDVNAQIGASLSRVGIIAIGGRRLLGLVPGRVHTVDPRAGEQIRQELRDVITGGEPEPTTATTLAILESLGLLTKVLDLPSSRGAEESISAVVARCKAIPAASAASRVGDAAMLNSLAASVVITTANS